MGCALCKKLSILRASKNTLVDPVSNVIVQSAVETKRGLHEKQVKSSSSPFKIKVNTSANSTNNEKSSDISELTRVPLTESPRSGGGGGGGNSGGGGVDNMVLTGVVAEQLPTTVVHLKEEPTLHTDKKVKFLNSNIQSTANSSANNESNVPSPSVTMYINNTKPNDKINNRSLATCRLRRSTDITEFYELSSEVLGTGISGAVRVANHKLTGRKYAIKTLSVQGVSSKKAAMLYNEVSIYLQLDHPNIAKLVEVFETKESIHLVMELCTGGELYDRLATKKKYNERSAAHVTAQMLSAINYCHQHHICHRDLKLENWVYADTSEDAPLKLIDFGFSRIFNPGVPMTAMHGTVYYVSPEVMDGCYQEKCDIWSIGVIVYMLLSGSPPFNGSYDHEILVKIKRGAFSFAGPRWEGISDCAKSFITSLLQKDPDSRPSAEEGLNHPWLQNSNVDYQDIDLAVLHSMRNFALGNILRRAALAVVALSMTSQDVEDLERAFKKFDKNNRGTIQLQDLASILREKLSIDQVEAQNILDKVSQTGDTEIHYSEFIASTLQAKMIKNESLVREAFNRFDVNKKQGITLANLRSVLGDNYNGSKVEDIMTLCDFNGDGVIDFVEFSKALTSEDYAIVSTSSSPTEFPVIPNEINQESQEKSQVTEGMLRTAAIQTLQSMRKATCRSNDNGLIHTTALTNEKIQ